MTKKSQQSKCYIAALKMLMRREHSKLELIQKLNLKEFDDAVINDSISLLAEQKYQSDARFSEAFILMRFNQGKGPVKISMELKSKGISKFDLTLFNWFELAKDVKCKKFGDSKSLDYKEEAKQKRFLQSRGFGFGEINQAFAQS
jgi:regulatory protein